MIYPDDFTSALNFSLKWEGGYSDHPADPGKLTIYGIASHAHPIEVAKMKELWDKDLKHEALEIAKKIYLDNYWLSAGCDKLEWPLCLVHFDTAVNLGVERANKLKEKALVIGNWSDYLFLRIEFYNGLKKPVFLSGWINRVIDLWKEAKSSYLGGD